MHLDNFKEKKLKPSVKSLYIEHYKEKIITIFLEDDFKENEMFHFWNMLKFLINNGLYFVLCINPINREEERWQILWSIESYNLSLQQQLWTDCLWWAIIELLSILEQLDIDTRIITNIKADYIWLNYWKNLELNINKIYDCFSKKIIPIVLPILTNKTDNQRFITNPISFIKDISLKLNSKKIIVSTTFFDEIKTISMMSSDKTKGLIDLSNNISYNLKRYLHMLLEFVEENNQENRWHIVWALSDIGTEILTVEWIWTMISNHSVEDVDKEVKYYDNKELLKRE